MRNQQNQVRYTIGRVRRYLKNPQEIRYEEVLKDIFECGLEYKMCANCDHDDIGYCGLRNAPISDYTLRTNYCFKSFLNLFDHNK